MVGAPRTGAYVYERITSTTVSGAWVARGVLQPSMNARFVRGRVWMFSVVFFLLACGVPRCAVCVSLTFSSRYIIMSCPPAPLLSDTGDLSDGFATAVAVSPSGMVAVGSPDEAAVYIFSQARPQV